MDLRTANNEWNKLTKERKLEIWDKLSKCVREEIEDGVNDLSWALLEVTVEFEDEDYFGTEGMKL